MENQDQRTVNSIQDLFSDSDFLNRQTVAWGQQEKIIYTTVAELKDSWAGGFSQKFTADIERYQPDVVDFANALSYCAATLGTVSNMYRKLEDEGTTMSAEEVESNTFNETDTGKSKTDVDDAFSPSQCQIKADQLSKAASNIIDIIGEMDNRIGRINNNYSSPAGTELIARTKRMVEIAPDFAKAVSDCAKFLIDTVAPEYDRIEKTAAR